MVNGGYGTGTHYLIDIPTPMSDNQWHNIIVTRDDVGKVVKLYLDGNYINSLIYTGTVSSSDNPLRIGLSAYNNGTYPFNGLIDDVRIYNRALSSQEATTLHISGLIAYGQCGSADGSSFYNVPIDNLCSYGTPSIVSGNGPWTWTCSGTSSSVSCSANKIEDGACGDSANIEHSSIPATELCAFGTASIVGGDGVPYTWTCNGVNGGKPVSCSATKTGWIDTGLGFFVMKYEAKIQGNDNGGQTYNSSFVPESRPSGTPWVNITQSQAIAECQSLGSGYHLITNNEWTALVRDIEAVPLNWSSGIVGSGYLSRGYAASTSYVGSNDAFTNSQGAPNTGSGYEYNTGQNTVGSSGDHRYKRVKKLNNNQDIWDISGNSSEWVSDICYIGSGNGYWYSSGAWVDWDNLALLDYEKPNYSTTGNYTSAHEIGKYFGCSSDGNTGHRGGSCQIGNNAGIFAISLNRSPSASDSYIGFLCVR